MVWLLHFDIVIIVDFMVASRHGPTRPQDTGEGFQRSLSQKKKILKNHELNESQKTSVHGQRWGILVTTPVL